MHIEIIRKEFLEDRSLGQLWIDGAFFCYTLEDTARADGVKVTRHTCVPPCTAKLTVSTSSRFNRLMVMASTEENGYEIIAKGISFKGIRFHGGNGPSDTEGCPLIAFNRDGNRIYGTAEAKFTGIVQDAILDGETVTCEFINSPKVNNEQA